MNLLRSFGPAALLFASAAYAQTPPPTTGGKAPSRPTVTFPTDRPPAPTSTVTFPTDLFRMNEVSRSISLTDRQVEQLNVMTQRLQTRYREQYDRLAGLPERERADRMLQLNREYTASWLGAAADVLDARQLTRYQQLQTQFGGFVSLTDPVVQKALNLNGDQLTRLRADITWSDQQLAAIREQAAIDQARALQMYNAFSQSAQERWNRLLTAEQARAWAQMTGDPFAFPPPFPAAPPPRR